MKTSSIFFHPSQKNIIFYWDNEIIKFIVWKGWIFGENWSINKFYWKFDDRSNEITNWINYEELVKELEKIYESNKWLKIDIFWLSIKEIV